MKFSPVDTLIPHRPPMCLIEEILSLTPQGGTVRSVITDAHLFLREDGTLAPEALCEIVAQSFAACEAQRREQQGLSNEGGGYLVNIRDFSILGTARAGDELQTHLIQCDDFLGTRIVTGEVFCNGQKLAVCTVYIFMWEGAKPPIV